jgi:hypothetical protein
MKSNPKRSPTNKIKLKELGYVMFLARILLYLTAHRELLIRHSRFEKTESGFSLISEALSPSLVAVLTV